MLMNSVTPFISSPWTSVRSACALLASTLLLATPVSGQGAGKIGLKQIAEGFTAPIVVTSLDDGSGRLLIADQIGTVSVVNKDGSLSDRLFLDLRSRMVKLNQGFDERGLLGLALHPEFQKNGKFYAYYSAPLQDTSLAEWDHTSRISEFQVSGTDRALANPASERIVLEVHQPYFNHNSGRLAFGPDGYLYIGLGDGGAGNDVGRGRSEKGNGQDTSTLMGSILRIDVNRQANGKAYAVPSDNPFASGGGQPEIFAYGLRNPWGMAFDRGGNRQLFVADVGQDSYEEVNIVTKGGNYGWNIREGLACFDPKAPTRAPEECPKVGADGKPLIDPIFVYKNFKKYPRDPEARGISITGGYVYRGKAFPQLQGQYIFGDWSRNWIRPDGVVYVAQPNGSGTSWTMGPLDLSTHPEGNIKAYLWAFGQDADGELYIMTNNSNSLIGKTGKVFKLVPM
jgi:glucose/arabinose dehydrogenase